MLYLDTSALVKGYVREPGSGRLVGAMQAAEVAAISVVGYGELMAALHRKHREGTLNEEQLAGLIEVFRSDWESFTVVDISARILAQVDRLLPEYALRGGGEPRKSAKIERRPEFTKQLEFTATACGTVAFSARHNGT